jgi:HK97 gp10 family phage protein
MASKLTIKGKLEGLEDTMKRMGRLKQSARGRIQRKAMNQATQPITRAVKANAPKGLGNLKRSIGRKVQTYRSRMVTVGIVGPRKGYGKDVVTHGGKTRRVDPVKYAHIVEKGRKGVTVQNATVLSDGTTVYGRTVAATRPQPFVRPAWDAGKSGAEATIARVCADEIKKEAAK